LKSILRKTIRESRTSDISGLKTRIIVFSSIILLLIAGYRMEISLDLWRESNPLTTSEKKQLAELQQLNQCPIAPQNVLPYSDFDALFEQVPTKAAQGDENDPCKTIEEFSSRQRYANFYREKETQAFKIIISQTALMITALIAALWILPFARRFLSRFRTLLFNRLNDRTRRMAFVRSLVGLALLFIGFMRLGPYDSLWSALLGNEDILSILLFWGGLILLVESYLRIWTKFFEWLDGRDKA